MTFPTYTTKTKDYKREMSTVCTNHHMFMQLWILLFVEQNTQ